MLTIKNQTIRILILTCVRILILVEEKHSSALNHRGLIKYCALFSPELIFFTYFTNCLLITITSHNNDQFGILISILSIAIFIFPYVRQGPLKQGELVLSTNYVSLLLFTRFFDVSMTYNPKVTHTFHLYFDLFSFALTPYSILFRWLWQKISSSARF